MSPNTPRPPLDLDQLELIIGWHRQLGLQLAFQHADDVTVTLETLQGAMVTELLRLTRLGLLFEQAATLPAASPETRLIHDMVAEAADHWNRRIR